MCKIFVNGLVAAKGLTQSQREDIFKLDKICREQDKLNMKLNLISLQTRPAEEVNDFLYYDEGKLVGFLGLYDIRGGSIEIEITGMVDPAYRKKGIMKALYQPAMEECKRRKVKSILLISERISPEGQSFVRKAGGNYTFSEYRMMADLLDIPEFKFPKGEFSLRPMKVEKDEVNKVLEVDSICFDMELETMESKRYFEEENKTFIAEENLSDGAGVKMVGKIGMSIEGDCGYIGGVAIKPEFRGKGYGRGMLIFIMNKLKEAGLPKVMLEVEATNDNALGLYKSVGFKEITVYDYFKLIP